MPYPRVQKSARQPSAADAALSHAGAALRVIDVAVDAAEFPEHPNPQLKIAVVLQSTALDVSWTSATGRAVQGQVACGSASVMPVAMPYRTHWRAGGRMLLLSFSPEFLQGRDAVLGRGRGELRPAWSQSDPLLRELGLAVLAAQQDGLASTAYLDAAAEMAMVHLLARYGSGCERRPAELPATGLARVLDMIESRIGEDLSIAAMADAAGMSVYGFARAFVKATGEPPHRYLLRRRCERARELLVHSPMRIVDIAAALGFSSQAHLTTVFARIVGTTPARLRATTVTRSNE